MAREEVEKTLLKRLESAFAQITPQEVEPTPRNDGSLSHQSGDQIHRFGPSIANTSAGLKHKLSGPSNDGPHTKPADLLICRLDHLHQERQDHGLGIVQHYAQELAGLATPSPFVSEQLELGTVPLETGYAEDQERANDLTKDLEWAVVEARHKSAVANADLKSAQLSLDPAGSLTIEAQLRALDSVKHELTGWLEDSLLLCGNEDDSDGVPEAAEIDVSTERDIDQVFQAYAGARTRLLEAINFDSSTSVKVASSVDDSVEMARIPVHQIQDRVIKMEEHSSTSTSRIDKTQARSYLEEVVAFEKTYATEMLQRLADESQLLTAYPMLNKSERTSHARKVFGETRDQNPDDVAEHAKAWSFAAGASGEASEARLTQGFLHGNHALQQTQKNIQDIEFLRNISTAA